MGRIRTERVEYRGWRDCPRLTNGLVELVVVPQIGGRTMFFGPAGGKNVLWENPTVSGQPARPADWTNPGGEKAWVWPQDDWSARTGRGWPPPDALDSMPWEMEIFGATIRLSSPSVVGYGLRVVREISLMENASRAKFVTTFRKVHGSPLPVGAWTITQIPAPDRSWAALRSRSTLPNFHKLMGDPPKTFERRGDAGSLASFTRDPVRSTKVGIDADALAAIVGDRVLVVSAQNPQGPGDLAPGERAQIYAHPDDDFFKKNNAPTYTELELTSPVRALKPGESLALTTFLSLHPLKTDEESSVRAALLEDADRSAR